MRELDRGPDESTAAPLSGGVDPDSPEGRRRTEMAYRVYSAISEAMPLEGRDYTVRILEYEGGRSSVRMQPLNEFGMAFCERARDFIRAAFAAPSSASEEGEDSNGRK